MSHYDSDDSTLVDERSRPRRPRRRYSSPSEDSYTTRQSYYSEAPRTERSRRESSPQHDGIGKATIAVGFLAALAGLFHIWNTKKQAERDREARHKRRRDFERAKIARRREEARRERERESRRHEDDESAPPSEVRRIAYAPTARSRSRSRAPKRIEGPPSDTGRASRRDSMEGSDYGYDRDYDNERRSRRG